ncbi:hypothetical protein V5O48_013928 [Marasmius crinis-equi]|uniref:Uncharacterized protein n=1 Tax=Marasmius crinis-equi TaxID=585013 RepID=A0ABR3EYQ6_9AGAR
MQNDYIHQPNNQNFYKLQPQSQPPHSTSAPGHSVLFPSLSSSAVNIPFSRQTPNSLSPANHDAGPQMRIFDGVNGSLNLPSSGFQDFTQHSDWTRQSRFSSTPLLPHQHYASHLSRHSTPALNDRQNERPEDLLHGSPGAYTRITRPVSVDPCQHSPNVAAANTIRPLSSTSTSTVAARDFFKPPPPERHMSHSDQRSQSSRTSGHGAHCQPLHVSSVQNTILQPQPLTWETPQVCNSLDVRSIQTSGNVVHPPTPDQQDEETDTLDRLGSSLSNNLTAGVQQEADAALARLLEPLTPSSSTNQRTSRMPIPPNPDVAELQPIARRSPSPGPPQPLTSNQGTSWSVAEPNGLQPATRARMGAAEKELKKYTTNRKLSKGVAKFVEDYDKAVETLANDLGVDQARVRKLIGFTRRANSRKDPTAYQAGLFKKAQEVNEGKDTGYRLKLKDIHPILKADSEMMAEIKRGKKSTKVQEWIKEAKAVREARFVGERGSEKAVAREATATMNRVKEDTENLSRSTGAFTFGFMCRSEFGSSVHPAYWGLGPIEDFLMERFNMTGFDFVSAAQAFACLDEAGDGKGVRKRKSKKAEVAALGKVTANMIAKGLQEVMGKSHGRVVGMEYKHYEINIVKAHGVKLTNWPSGTIDFDSPTNIKNGDHVRELYDLVRSGTIRWVKLSKTARAREVELIDEKIKNGTLIPPSRATRSDKGGTHEKRARADTAGEEAAQPPAKKARRNSRKAPPKENPTPAFKSSEFVNDSDEETEQTVPASTPTAGTTPTLSTSGSSNLIPPPNNHNSARMETLRTRNPALDDEELQELFNDEFADHDPNSGENDLFGDDGDDGEGDDGDES